MKVMGDCLSCFGRNADASEKAEPNPFLVAKAERERDGTLCYTIIGEHEGLSNRPGSQSSRRQPHGPPTEPGQPPVAPG